ncbi:MAG: hypothetical protein K0U78_00190 [Actinomycetia bacterium]|nr:hypothetical protein [Actinomycetes bacterium]
MALSKTVVTDKYEIVGEHKHVQCRHATVISEDGVELSRSFHRHVIAPGDDVSNEPAETQAIVAAVHTPEVISAYNEMVAAQALETGV